jgi:uncharacterized membrane protein (UPF0127 family)
VNDGTRLRVLVDGNLIADKIIYCSSSASRREGLLSLDHLEQGEGILMEMPGSRRGKKGFITSIHMLGMRFPISAAWLNNEGRVVHSTLAKPWGLYYGSPQPAWYVLEAHPDLIDSLSVGTVLNWELTA